jgi:hypothetical protein
MNRFSTESLEFASVDFVWPKARFASDNKKFHAKVTISKPAATLGAGPDVKVNFLSENMHKFQFLWVN